MTALAAFLFAQAPKPLADVPFVHEAGRVWLKGSLNGRLVDAALDTGASYVVADAEAALAAGAKKGESFSVYSLGSQATETWPASGLVFTLDGLDARHDVAYATSLKRIQGEGPRRLRTLIGTDFIRRFVVQIDYPQSRVRFYEPKTYVPSEEWKVLPIRFVEKSPVVAVWLRLPGDEEKIVQAMIDTGTTGVTLTGSFAKREDLHRRFPNMKPYERAGGIGGRATGSLLYGVTGDFAGAPLYGAAFVDTTKVGATGPNAPFDALIGDDALVGRVVTLDYGRSKMYLSKARR